MPEVISDIAVGGTAQSPVITFRLVSAADNITVSLDESNIEVYEGDTVQLNASVAPEEHAGMAVEWSSSSPAVARVDANGLVTAAAPGRAVITAKLKGGTAQASCNVTVEDISVTLDKNDMELTINAAQKLNVTVSPEDYAGIEIEWKSNNTAVATVDADGLVKGISSGLAVITAKLKGRNAEAACKVSVVDPESPVYIDAVRQNDLWIRWDHSDEEYEGRYHVGIMRGDEEEAVTTSPESRAYVDKLLPGTAYSAGIYIDDNGKPGKRIGELSFNTLEAEDFHASIGFTAPDAEGRTTVYLNDVADRIETVKWTLNGETLEQPRFSTETPGRYVVTAEYETADYGETITKVITIK
jgi:hypothetical protein